MERWIVTGISGSGRIELLETLRPIFEAKGKNVLVSDVGELIRQECIKNRIPFKPHTILDIDRPQLNLLRSSALKEAIIAESKADKIDLHFIGIHTTFRWRERLISGISFKDVVAIQPTGFVNVVDDVKEIIATNQANPKWTKDSLPDPESTQEWLIEEEFTTEVLAEVLNVPMYLVARKHNVDNLAELFINDKKKIYLSYPITAVKDENPEMLAKIQDEIVPTLESLFVVFNPLAIEDMKLTYPDLPGDVPELVRDLTPRAREIIKTRTIERDFQFIDQSDAVVVFYMTQKLSPGVMAEIYYAHRNQKPVFMLYPYDRSPFMEDATYTIEKSIEDLMAKLKEFSEEMEVYT